MYAHTFGQTTQDSVECTYHKGHDLPPEERFKTTDKANAKQDLADSFYKNTGYGQGCDNNDK